MHSDQPAQLSWWSVCWQQMHSDQPAQLSWNAGRLNTQRDIGITSSVVPTEEIALHPVDRTIAPPFCRSRQCPNISARLNQQRRHVTADETGCACYEDVLADEKMMEIVRDHAA